MKPLSVIRSEALLEELGTDSAVCGAYYPETIFQKQAPNEWVEPGEETIWRTDTVWEWLTGTYEDLVMDEDREVWVIHDAGAPKEERPARPVGSHDYATRMDSREPVYLTHATRADALAAIAAEIGDGVSVGRINIWSRPRDSHIFRYPAFFPPGTRSADLPDA